MKSYFIFLIAIFSYSFIYAQNVGIGTTTPQASFNVAAGQTVLFGNDTLSAGKKLMWLPSKSAFRVGYYWGLAIDSIGSFSTAMGGGTANGFASTAMGSGTTVKDYSTAMGGGTASGYASTVMGFSVFASGDYSTAIGNSKATNSYSTAIGKGQANGQYSTAMGFSISDGDYSTAMGNSSAIGPNSTALGGGSVSFGPYSTAMSSGITKGQFSTSMGLYATAKSDFETVVGSYNDTSSTNRIFEIGNGKYGALSNAMTVLSNGNVGIGTVNPIGTFNVAKGKTVLFGDDTTSQGNKLMWFPNKAAFRTGFYDGTFFDTIGRYSTAMGSSFANGELSTALGQSIANGTYSTAMGTSIANGYNSTAICMGIANAQYSTAMGNSTTANSNNETVIGTYNDTSFIDRLFEIGNGTSLTSHNVLTVLNNGNVGIGNAEPELAGLIVDSKVGAENAMFGSNTTGVCIESSYPGIAFNTYYNGGRKFIANGYGGLISLNQSSGDMVFYGYGSGTAGAAPIVTTGMGLSSNCLYPLSNNAYTLGNSSLKWSAVWAVNGIIQTSDARLKKNITSSSYGLKEIMKLQPVTYDWKDGSNQQPMLGLLAQEVQKLIPEAVVGNEQKEYLGIKYDALIPVLIKGMQELENKNEQLGNENISLQQKNDKLESRLDALSKQVETLAAIQQGNNTLIATDK